MASAITFEDKIQASIAAKTIPGCILTATSKHGDHGRINYTKAFGPFDVGDYEGKPMDVDAPMTIMSCTKFMTSVAVMQCVERGILDLDEDVVKLLPEFKDKEIIAGFDEGGAPVMKKNTKPLTLR